MNPWNRRTIIASVAMLIACGPALAQAPEEPVAVPDAAAAEAPAAAPAEAAAAVPEEEVAPIPQSGPQLSKDMTLYSGATPRSRQLAIFPKGTRIKVETGVDNSYGRWLLVVINGQRGWISNEAPPPTP